ncbi:hypothetical protein BKA82DRAFT_3987144, partial [Pisolithus tinctorius]
SGFKGQHIIKQLVKRDPISMLDIVQRHHDVLFYLGGIIDDQDMLEVLDKLGATCILHLASLQQGMRDPSVYYKANIKGI